MLSVAAAEGLLGGPVTEVPAGVDLRTISLGVLECSWARDQPDDAGHTRDIRVAAFPTAVVDSSTKAKYVAPVCEQDYDVALCKVAVTAGGHWLLVETGAIDYQMTEPIPAYLPLAAKALADSASRFEPAEPYSPGIPADPMDCTVLGDHIDVATAVGEAAQPGFPTGGVNSSTSAQIAISAGVYQWCAWTVYDIPNSLPYVWYDIYPFDGWMWQEFTKADRGPVEPVTVPGATHAVQRVGLTEGEWMAVTDGTIVITLSGDDGVDIREAAARMLAAVGGNDRAAR